MIYLLHGNIEHLIKKEINKIISENKIDNEFISKYDLNNDSLKEILQDANSMSLFEDKKIIIVENSFVFTSKNKTDYDISELEFYLNNINENTILIFTTFDKVDERKKIVKKIKDNFSVVDFSTTNIHNEIKELFKGFTISDENIEFFIKRVGEDLLYLASEITKIKIYKDDKVITRDDIIDLTVKSYEENNFKLIEAIITKDKKSAIELYNERLLLNEEPIAILVSIANQIRVLYQVKQFIKSAHTEKEIATILGIHPYRVKLANINSKKFSDQILKDYLYELADLDYKIKSGSIDKKIGLEMFILNI